MRLLRFLVDVRLWVRGIALLAVLPYRLGTDVAVQLGAGNPSTARSVTGWIFEAVCLSVLALAVLAVMRFVNRRRVARDLSAAPDAGPTGPVITTTRQGNSLVYKHGACPIDHRTAEAAATCRNP